MLSDPRAWTHVGAVAPADVVAGSGCGHLGALVAHFSCVCSRSLGGQHVPESVAHLNWNYSDSCCATLGQCASWGSVLVWGIAVGFLAAMPCCSWGGADTRRGEPLSIACTSAGRHISCLMPTFAAETSIFSTQLPQLQPFQVLAPPEAEDEHWTQTPSAPQSLMPNLSASKPHPAGNGAKRTLVRSRFDVSSTWALQHTFQPGAKTSAYHT